MPIKISKLSMILNSPATMLFLGALLFWSLCMGCSSVKPSSTNPSPLGSYQKAPTSTLVDSDSWSGLAAAVEAQINYLMKQNNIAMNFGSRTVTRIEYLQKLEGLLTLLRTNSNSDQIQSYLATYFETYAYRSEDSTKNSGEVLLTGYFEPEIQGSRHQTEKFSLPLYALPSDLISVELNLFGLKEEEGKTITGRVSGKTLVPYFSRAEIDGELKSLADQKLELCWVDPIDAFFLHIQGSGTVMLDDGSSLSLNYAGKNGHKYAAIGRFVRDLIAPEVVTMQSIDKYLRSLTAEKSNEIMFANPSYVFFKPSVKRAVTASGESAVARRTIAVDPQFIPLGTLGLLSYRDTDGSNRNLYVSALDVGGAIKGAHRVDLFTGRGAQGKAEAGPLQSRGILHLLIPKNETTHPQVQYNPGYR